MIRRTRQEYGEVAALYPLRWGSFLGSFSLHWLLIGLVVFVVTQYRALETTLYYEPAPPSERKTLYFDVRYQLPDVTSSKTAAADPRGAEVSHRTVVAASPKPSSAQQIIVQPMPLPELPKDIVTPDLVARLNVELPPAPKPAPARRSFVPPP